MSEHENGTQQASGEHNGGGEVRRSYLGGVTFGVKEVYYLDVDGDAIFEGDILLGTVEEMESIRQEVEDPDPAVAAAAVVLAALRWPGGVIPFRILPSLPNPQRVRAAMQHIVANTNVRFVERTDQENFVTFRPAGGCSAHVGMRGGEQFVNLGPQCSVGNTVHEICHAAGLFHEQSREDRDEFVRIDFTNIQAGRETNFNQHITDGDDVGDYDYGSVMHYPPDAFAIDPSRPTIIPLQDTNGAQLGQRAGLSAGDVAALNFLYPR